MCCIDRVEDITYSLLILKWPRLTSKPHAALGVMNFGRPFLGHHNIILSLSDLCLGVEKKIFKEIMHFHYRYILLIWPRPSIRTPTLNFLCSLHIWVSFLKIYGFNDYNKFKFLAWKQLTCLCIICPAFVVLEKLSWEWLGI